MFPYHLRSDTHVLVIGGLFISRGKKYVNLIVQYLLAISVLKLNKSLLPSVVNILASREQSQCCGGPYVRVG